MISDLQALAQSTPAPIAGRQGLETFTRRDLRGRNHLGADHHSASLTLTTVIEVE